MAEHEIEEFYQEPEEEPPAIQYVPLRARAYHISQDAIDYCNQMERSPADTIVAQGEYIRDLKILVEEKDKAMRDMMRIVPQDGRPIYTLEEFGETVRKVTQVEGVMLHEKQKGFFRDLFSGFMQVVKGRGAP